MARDLRKVMERILRSWGHDIVLQRRILDARTGLYATADNNGFSTTLERWTVRHTLKRPTSLMSAMQGKPEGITVDVNMIYYFSWDAAPKDGDRIYELDPRYDKITTDSQFYSATYIVDYAQPMRGQGGRVEYWEVGATRENPN